MGPDNDSLRFPQLSITNPLRGISAFNGFGTLRLASPSLLGGTISSGIATGLNRPPEYGPTWPGFEKRNGVRLTGVATSNAMEASLGMLWGEDPRYVRAAPGRFKTRVWNVVKMTFVAKNSLGENSPAFPR